MRQDAVLIMGLASIIFRRRYGNDKEVKKVN